MSFPLDFVLGGLGSLICWGAHYSAEKTAKLVTRCEALRGDEMRLRLRRHGNARTCRLLSSRPAPPSAGARSARLVGALRANTDDLSHAAAGIRLPRSRPRYSPPPRVASAPGLHPPRPGGGDGLDLFDLRSWPPDLAARPFGSDTSCSHTPRSEHGRATPA